MRIFYFCAAFRPTIGGLEVLSEEFAAAMTQRGHRVTVVTNRPTPRICAESSWRGFTVHRLDLRRPLADRDLPRLRVLHEQIREIRKSFQPDVIHWNDSGPSSFFFPFARESCDAPAVFSLHEPFLAGHRDGIKRKALQRADWVVSVSNSLLNDAITLEPAILNRSSTIHNCLPAPEIPPTRLPFDPPTLLCIGRVVREKGFDLALRAMARLKPTWPRVRLVIAGDGIEKRNLEQMNIDLGLEGHVEFTGWIEPEAIPALVNQATAILMPGRWKEPFGLVALQAAQMGRPVISSRVGGVPEIVDDGITGLLMAPESEDDLADAIHKLLEDPARTIEMGMKARCRAEAQFSFDRFLDAYETLYHRVGA
jgi:glycogen(starch) synthase